VSTGRRDEQANEGWLVVITVALLIAVAVLGVVVAVAR
jgi:hypothetical protein